MAKGVSKGGKGDPGKGARAPMPGPPPGGQSSTSARRFLQESYGELRKVQWPSRPAIAQGTMVVALVTFVFAIYLTIVDFVVVRIVNQINAWVG